MAYADLADFTARLGRSLTAGAETDRAQAALDDASALIDTVATVPDPVPSGVLSITCSVALRLFGNPSQFTSETIDDYTWRVDGAGLFLTPYEENALRRLSSDTTSSGLWTQSLTRDGDDVYVFGYDQYSGDPILLAEGCTDPDVIA